MKTEPPGMLDDGNAIGPWLQMVELQQLTHKSCSKGGY